MILSYPVEALNAGLPCMEAGENHMMLGELDEALAAFDHALVLLPGLPHAEWNRVLVLLAMGRYGDAFAQFHLRKALIPVIPDRLDILDVN